MTKPAQLLHDLLDNTADTSPDNVAMTSLGHSRTYRQLAAATFHVARCLQEMGVSRGDRVAVKSTDGLVVTALVYAASRLGAAFTVLHDQVRGEPLTHVLQDCEPILLVSDDVETADVARQHDVHFLASAELSDVVLDAETPPEDLLRPVQAGVPVDPVCLIYTSGTTSLPKAVVGTHEQVLFATGAIQACLSYRDDDVIYCPLPLSFDYGLYQAFLAASSGAHLWLGTSAEAGPPLLRHLLNSGATILPGVPSVSDRLAWLLRRSNEIPKQLRLLTNTGAALADGTMAALRHALPGLQIQVMYGLTECKRTAIMPPDGDLDRPGSCGRPLPGTEVLVIDDGGKRLPPGELGQFVVRGPHVMAGYWRRPELNAARFHRAEDLFPELHTGDYGWLDHDGYLYFSGRRDDIYKERGFRVSATEVESAAQRVAGVNSAALVPPEGTRMAMLAVDAEIIGEEVLERMRAHIEEFKIPRRCVRLSTLPTNANGKFDRAKIATLITEPAASAAKESN